MSILKLKIFGYRKSLYIKVLVSMFVALLTIIFIMQISNIYVLDIYQKRAISTYQNSLKLYSDYWNGKFDVINSSLITLASTTSDNNYNNICFTEDRLILETSKVVIMRRLDDLVRINNQFGAFIYVPSRNINLESYNNLGKYAERISLGTEIKKYIENTKISNSKNWDILKIGDKNYFIKVYHIQKGYVGAIIECETILKYLLQDKSVEGATALIDQNNTVVYELRKGIGFDISSSSVFSEELRLTDYKIGIIVSKKTLYTDRTFIVLIMVGIFIIGIIIVLFNMWIQMKIVLNPLNNLKKAMERFSSGDMKVRLEENLSSHEINTLYKTFNLMAGQITDLKIDVYESKLEKQEVQSSFLRVQIQPHFYTNILNLIYGLSEVASYKNIQKICIFTSNYFRYLLSDKNIFVTLDKEIDCVKNYVEIQKMRYPELLKFELETNLNSILQMVPPLILQTFVENSIKHNVTYVPILNVSVNIAGKDDKLVFNIKDNGLGFSDTLIERLNADENISEDGKHIGIVNVKQRLKLIYGSSAQVVISSKEKETIVKIKIPIISTESGK